MIAVDQLETIGNRYRLNEVIGRGGMGIVFKAYDRLMGSTIALKRVTTPGNDLIFTTGTEDESNFQLALAHEFKILASLRHPNIISVLDYGFDHQKMPYFTMSYLDGAINMVDAAKGKSVEERVMMLIELFQALAYLHRRGILHRDLKPANILVENDQVKVLDFGLSLRHSDRGSSSSGTFAYMSPEVLGGSQHTERSDIYAAGIIAYEIFTGTYPYQTDNITRLLDQIMTDPVDVSRFGNLDPRLVAVLMQILAKNPADRYGTAREVIEALSTAIDMSVPAETVATRESYLQAAEFIGRDDEFATLSNGLAQASKKHGSGWLVGGESGVGKSRLLGELRIRALVDGMLVLRGQAVTETTRPYQIWRDTLRWLSIIQDLTDLQASVLKQIIPDLSDLLERPIPDAVELDPQATQDRQLDVIEALFRQLDQPALLMLEDLQWATPENLKVLARLAKNIESLPLFIVGSYRSDEKAQLPEQFPEMHVMRLKPMGKETMTMLASSMLGTDQTQSGVVDILANETQGNVLYLIEILRTLANDAGDLDRIGFVTLPTKMFAGGVYQLIRRRLSQLPADALALLQFAAVAGRELDLALIQQANGGHSLEGWLQTCSDLHVLDVEDEKWRFSHDSLRESLLKEMNDAKQQQLNREVAEAYEATYPNTNEYAAKLAYHWARAANTQKEAYYTQIAGIQAYEAGVMSDVVMFLSRTLELQQNTLQPILCSKLEQKLAEAHISDGKLAEAKPHIRNALTALKQPDPFNNGQRNFDMLRKIVQQVYFRMVSRNRVVSDEQRRDEMLTTANAYLSLGTYALFGNFTSLLLYAVLGSVNFAEYVGPSDALAGAYGSMCFGVGVIPLHKAALTYHRLSLETSKIVNQPITTVGVAQRLAIYNVGAARLDNAYAMLIESSKIAEQIGAHQRFGEAQVSLAIITYIRGDFAESLTHAEALLKSAQAHNTRLQIMWGYGAIQSAQYGLGNLEEAVVAGESAFEHIVDAVPTASRHGQMAVAYVRTGKVEKALPLIAKSLQTLGATRPTLSSEFEGYQALGEACFTLLKDTPTTSPDYAARLKQCQEMTRFTVQFAKVFPTGVPLKLQFEGQLAHFTGKPDKAFELLKEGIAAAHKAGMRYAEGQIARFIGQELTTLDAATRSSYLQQAKQCFEKTQSKYDLKLLETQSK